MGKEKGQKGEISSEASDQKRPSAADIRDPRIQQKQNNIL